MKFINIAKGITSSYFLKTPFYVHLFVTRKCNLRCKMCNVWRQEERKRMNIDQIRKAAKKIKKLGATHVVITGGEATLRKDLVKIIATFSKLGISTRLQSNAILITEKKLDEMLKAGLNDITISLDTLDNRKQDSICGVKRLNISDKALSTLKLAVKKMPKSMVVANTVVSHKNLEEISGLIKYLDSLGIWSTPTCVNLAKDNNYLFKAKANDFAFTKVDKEKAVKVYNKILKLKKQGLRIGLSTHFIKESLNYIKTGRIKWRCDAGELYFSILPDGQFALCDEIATDLNILDKNFIRKFQSKDFKKYIKTVQENCEGCFYGCWRETSYLIKSFEVLLDRILTITMVKIKDFIKKI